jgi:transcription elongation factor Elf1
MGTDLLAELIGTELPNLPENRNWPHKCDLCGRFVKLTTLHSTMDGDGEYWATAHCGNCGKRVNANPI